MESQENPTPALLSFSIITMINGDELLERSMTPDQLSQSIMIVHDESDSLSEFLTVAMAGPATRAPAPASNASIEALKVVTDDRQEKSEEECTICLERLFTEENKETVVKEMPCGHMYHGECIEHWLRIHGSCPLCRYEIPLENGEDQEDDEGPETENDVWFFYSY